MSLRLLRECQLGVVLVLDLTVEKEEPVAGPSTVRGNVENAEAIPVPQPLHCHWLLQITSWCWWRRRRIWTMRGPWWGSRWIWSR